VREIFFDVGEKKPVDFAVVDLHFPENGRGGERLVFGEQETFELRVALQATGKEMNANVECEVGGKKLTPRAAALKAGQSGEVVFVIDCPQLGLKAGPHQLRVHLRPDLHAATDQRFATFTVQEPRRVLVVRDEARAGAAAVWKKAVEARRDYLL